MLQKSGRLVLWEAMFILELHSAETQEHNSQIQTVRIWLLFYAVLELYNFRCMGERGKRRSLLSDSHAAASKPLLLCRNIPVCSIIKHQKARGRNLLNSGGI